MDKFERIYRLHAVLDGRKSAISARDLQEKLGCSRATLNRDIALFKDYLHAPLEFDADAGGYRFLTASGTFELPGLWFSAAELQALVFLQRLAEDSGGGILQEEIQTLSRHLSELTKHKRLHLEEASTRLRFPALVARPAGSAFASVLSATLRRKQLSFGYHSRGSNERTQRMVSPQRVVHYREAWYMDSWDEAKHDLRSFSVDRMSNAVEQTDSARAVPENELDEHFAGAFGIFGGRPDKVAVLLFTAERARWVADEVWHPKKSARFLEDGTYELSVPYRDSRELVMEILRHGPHVKVIAPESLRHEVLQQLTATLDRYNP
jgi:predicted DNA-binding transcriptional regulator YafY